MDNDGPLTHPLAHPLTCSTFCDGLLVWVDIGISIPQEVSLSGDIR